jgi:manganese-dependent inorganic pyrophosphatase
LELVKSLKEISISYFRGEAMEEVIYITGHKNPDTDSICASIAYAELKKKFGIPAIPVRIGEINRETKFVLKYFGVRIPDYLESVKTQISDLNIDIINPVAADISMKTAWSIMRENNTKVLPVADEEGRLIGIITQSDISGSYMNALENNILSTYNTPLINIMDALKAKLITACDNNFRLPGKVVIAAMMTDSVDPFIDKGDIVLVGNRIDTQVKAIEIGASCLIITCGEKIGAEVLELAKERECIIMETEYDTFTAARLINQSIPVGFIMTHKDMVCFRFNDYIDSIKDRMINTRYRSYPVMGEDSVIKGFVSRYHLISQRRKKIILLDHNEKSQTIDGIEQAEILEIIDHHRIGDIQTGYPIYFSNDAVGSTSTLIANLYSEKGIKPSKEIAGILCAAIISDTMHFKSPTNTSTDVAAASRLAEIADINIEEFAMLMFGSASVLDGMSPEEILNYDCKDYVIDKYKIGIGQISSFDISSYIKMKGSLLEYMNRCVNNKDYRLLLLMVTDIMNEESYMLIAGDDELISKAFGVQPIEGSICLKGVVSRKKQIVPLITKALQF